MNWEKHVKYQLARELNPLLLPSPMDTGLGQYNHIIDRAVKERCEREGYEYDPCRLSWRSIAGVGELWYYIQDDGSQTPLVAFSPMDIKYSEEEDFRNIKVTISCNELPMDVFKPKIHEENSNPFRKGL